MKTIGIIGGGQLAKMLTDEAHKLGHKTIILEPCENACSKLNADAFIKAKYDDIDALNKLAQLSNVITYEFENVSCNSILYLESIGANVPQGDRPLHISQNRIREKSLIKKLKILTPNFIEINDSEFVNADLIKFPAILKTCSGGYDGKGQWEVNSIEELNNLELKDDIQYILEEKIQLKKEVSCIVCRNKNEEMICFPIFENIHVNGILDTTILNENFSQKLRNQIVELSQTIMEELKIYGILAIEYFIDESDQIYFNEMAPRPHNSGHITIDACDYSQFNLHLKSILNEELVKPNIISNGVMKNILGQDEEKIKNFDQDEKTILHVYGKSGWVKNRKMGHINFIGEDINNLLVNSKRWKSDE